jgi:Phage integrase family
MRSSTMSSAALASATATTFSFETSLPSFAHGDGVSSVVKRAMKRAGVVTPAKGAHVLRHTAATEMLRHGVPLDQIALVLRHRGVDTTAYYAKADVNSLKQIAQPWPEALKGEGGIAGRANASGLGCSRGSYRRHAIKGVNANKGDPSGSSASL